jgi:hypothetical protein
LPPILRLPLVLIVVVPTDGPISLIVVLAGSVLMLPMGVRRRLGSILIHLALKNQGSDPNRLDYREDERSNETCDNRRKYSLTYHDNSMTGECGAVPRIVRGVMNRRQRRKTDEVHEPEPDDQGEGSNDTTILRQGPGA